MSSVWQPERLERAWQRRQRSWLVAMGVAVVVMVLICTVLVVTTRAKFATLQQEPVPAEVAQDASGPVYRGQGMTLRVDTFDATTELRGEDEPPYYRPPQGSVFVVVHIEQLVTDKQHLAGCTLMLGHEEQRWESGVGYSHWYDDVSSPLIPDDERCLSASDEPQQGSILTFGKVFLVPEGLADQVRPVIEVDPWVGEGQVGERRELVWL